MTMGRILSVLFFTAISIMAKDMQITLDYTIAGLFAFAIVVTGISRAYSPVIILVLLYALVAHKVPYEKNGWIFGWAVVALALTSITEDDGFWYTVSAEIHNAAYYIAAISAVLALSVKCNDVKETSIYIAVSYFAAISFNEKTKASKITKNVLISICAGLVAYFIYLHTNNLVWISIKV